MQLENPLTFVRAMKGAPISILVAFMFAGKSLSNLELQQWTNYKDEAITPALKLLCTLGWLTAQSSRGPWCLAEGRQLPLMSVGAFEYLAQTDHDRFEKHESGLTGYPATTTTTTIEERKTDKSVVVVDREMNPVKPDSTVYETPGVTFEGNLKACRDGNIGEPKASQIAKMPWVSPDFIKAHVESLYASDRIGLAIVRIEGNELPRLWLEEAQPVKKSGSSSFVCADCGNHPCTCYEHEDDCLCIQCQSEHPERFCAAVDHGRHGSRECGSLVLPGQKYCERHNAYGK